MRKLLLFGLGLAFGLVSPLLAAPDPVVRESVAVCDPGAPTSCAKPNSTGQLIVAPHAVTIAAPTTPATGTGTPTSVSVGTSSAQALAATVRTQRLVIQNVSATASVACSLGGTAALNTGASFMIGPGQVFNLGDGLYIPGDAVNCIASAAATPITAWSR